MSAAAAPDPDTQRKRMLDAWNHAAAGWRRRADAVRAHGMPVSVWLIEHLALQPGQRVLELAAGPGDTGFMAAELIAPGGELITSDASEAMLEVARERAEALEVRNVTFKRLELEWIDLETASVDAVICRWGVMLLLDPDAALREIRRVLRPGGRVALAVWDAPERNPWATIGGRALAELGIGTTPNAEPPDPNAPGMFAFAAPGRLQEALEAAGFLDVVIDAVEVERVYPNIEEYLREQLDLSRTFASALEGVSDEQRAEVESAVAGLATPHMRRDASVRFEGRALVAAAEA